jgi:uncharacterized membrane protein YcaP (DUF421 family)
VLSVNSQVAAWLSPHLDQFVLMSLICLTSLYGVHLNKSVKRLVGRRGFFARTIIFVLVTGIGLGSVVILVAPLIIRLLGYLDITVLPTFVVIVFIALGVLADRKNQI